MAIEKTLAIIKPDGVQRSLMGEIIKRFERAGLKVIAMKLVWANEEMVGIHYEDNEEYLIGVGEKAIEGAKEKGVEITETALEIGQRVRKSNMKYMTTGPVLAFVLQGNTAVKTVRNLVGGTNPLGADIGSVRGDLSIDDFSQADAEGRSVRNLMHASGEAEEAEREIPLWFKEEEIHDYQNVMDKVLHDPSWGK